MRLATWNINSIRARVDRAVAFLERHDVDVLALQETKCKPEQFPLDAFTEAGYQVHMVGFDQWNGVAIASRIPLADVRTEFPGQPIWQGKGIVEARAIGATVMPSGSDPFELWSLYVPNGRELDDPHYRYKLDFLAALREYATSVTTADEAAQLVMVGDWNIAPMDEDVWDIGFFEGKTHVSQPERDAFDAFMAEGFKEITRPYADNYTYWDYQQLRFPKNEGMKIDFMVASSALAQRVVAAEIDRNERKGKGASDHVPVIVDIH